MSTLPRRIVVLLPVDMASNQQALLQAAAALRTDPDPGLDVLQLGAAAGQAAPALPAGTTWWACRAPLRPAPASPGEQLAQAWHALQTLEIPAAQPVLVLLPADPLCEELAARLAARLGGATLGRCLSVALGDGSDSLAVTAHRAGWSGRVDMALHSQAHWCFATWRPARPAAPAGWLVPHTREVPASAVPNDELPRTPLASTDAARPVEGAPIVVSGGRGVKDSQGFELLAQLAQRLGAAVGGSLPTIDAGLLPVARQIGQSGKFVSPKVYVAVGISGTPQHLAGVSSETPIVAINNDAQAPIFQVAELGVVADYQALLPALLHALDQLPPAT
jgi:electron transfer flavoprotein alpha subunit